MIACAGATGILFWLYAEAALLLVSRFIDTKSPTQHDALLQYLWLSLLFLIPASIELLRNVSHVMTFREEFALVWLSLNVAMTIPFAAAFLNLDMNMPMASGAEVVLLFQTMRVLLGVLASVVLLAFEAIVVLALFSRTRPVAVRMAAFGFIGAIASFCGTFWLSQSKLLEASASTGLGITAFAVVATCIAAIDAAKKMKLRERGGRVPTWLQD